MNEQAANAADLAAEWVISDACECTYSPLWCCVITIGDLGDGEIPVYGIDKPDAERRARLIVDAVKRYAEAERLRAGLEELMSRWIKTPHGSMTSDSRMYSELCAILNPTPKRKES
jgi:hypothetical protein